MATRVASQFSSYLDTNGWVLQRKDLGFSGAFYNLVEALEAVYTLHGVMVAEFSMTDLSKFNVDNETTKNISNALEFVLQKFATHYLPELLCSPDSLVREAAAKVMDERGEEVSEEYAS